MLQAAKRDQHEAEALAEFEAAHVALDEAHGQPLGSRSRRLDHRGAVVDADDAEARAGEGGGDAPGAAAEFQHVLAAAALRRFLGEIEVEREIVVEALQIEVVEGRDLRERIGRRLQHSRDASTTPREMDTHA